MRAAVAASSAAMAGISPNPVSLVEDCTEEKYNELVEKLYEVDLLYVKEDEDNTDLSGEVACAGGQCEVDFSYANSVDTKSQDPQ